MSGLDIQTLILGWMALCALVAAVTGTLGVYRGLRMPPRPAEVVEPAPERKKRMPWANLLVSLRYLVGAADNLKWVPHQTRSRDFLHMMIGHCGRLMSKLSG